MMRVFFSRKWSILIFLAIFSENIFSADLSPVSSITTQVNPTVSVAGIVTDDQGVPLPGVTVLIKGKSIGVVTDIDGKYEIITSVGSVIKFSYVGMTTQEHTVKDDRPLNITLEYDAQVLGETVITGYNRTTTRRVTGSVAVVDVDDLVKESPLKNIDQLIQGQVAGVAVTNVSGRPGQSAKITIRGTSTLMGNDGPLWIIDGVPLQKDIPKFSQSQLSSGALESIFSDGIASINPSDIENITILKDASATAIYGSRAAGGVIVVTTKRGKSGPFRANFSSNFSIQSRPQRDANLMTSKEKLAFEQELWDEFSAPTFNVPNAHYPVVGIVGAIRAGKGPYNGWSVAQQDAYIEELGKTTTDWFDVLFRNTFSQSYNFSGSGGGEKHSYYLSLNYSTNDGIIKKTNFDRYGAALKIDTKVNDKLSFEFDTDFSYMKSQNYVTYSGTSPITYAYFANPYESPYNEDGSYRSDQSYFSLAPYNGGNTVKLPPNGFNLLRELDESTNTDNGQTVSLRGAMVYRINPDLRFNGLASYSYVANSSASEVGKDTYTAWMDRPFDNTAISDRTYGNKSQASSNSNGFTLRGQLSYDKHINSENQISLLGGSEISWQKAESIQMKRYGYDPLTGNSSIPVPGSPNGNFSYDDLVSFGKIVDGLSGQSVVENAKASFYFSGDYTYKRKYTGSVSFRMDGANNFGKDEQFNPIGSVGFSWNVDQENFFAALKPVLSSLTFRTSTGYTGNIVSNVYPQIIMSYSPDFRKTYDDYYRMGMIQNPPNKHLRWEKTFDYKFGIDAGFLNNRFRLLAEYYHRQTTDAVSVVRIPSSTGYRNQSINTSELQNRGIEISLSGTLVKTKDFSWSTSINMAHNLNKLTKYTPTVNSLPSSVGNYVNYPVNSMFGGKPIGIDPETGIYMYKLRPDANATSDVEKRDAENYMFYLGTNNAPISGGFNMRFAYKELSLSVGGVYFLHSKVINNLSAPQGYVGLVEYQTSTGASRDIFTQENDLYRYHFNASRDARNRWTPDNPRTDGNPRIIDAFGTPYNLYLTNPTSSTITKGSMLEDVSFLKVSSLSLFYNLPESVYRIRQIQSISLSLSINNLFSLTNYTGIDPETPGAVYPMSRTYSFGASFSF